MDELDSEGGARADGVAIFALCLGVLAFALYLLARSFDLGSEGTLTAALLSVGAWIGGLVLGLGCMFSSSVHAKRVAAFAVTLLAIVAFIFVGDLIWSANGGR